VLERIPQRVRRALLGVLALALILPPPAWSQRRQFIEPNVPYDGKFTFVRLRYTQGYRMAWSADYPQMERNFMTILQDLSAMRLHQKGSNVHTLDDPRLGQYPVAYLTEPGYWYPTDEEALALRKWILKGGFLWVDDFYFDRQWQVFEEGMKKVLPEGRIERLDASHAIFNSFFSLKSLEGMTHPATRDAKAEYLGIYEDNDPAKRLQVVISFNNDIGDYMEWSGEGWYPVNLSNDAYKFATNFMVYGLTH
jgi:hypothetical protein